MLSTLTFDLTQVPFSRAGSFLALSLRDAAETNLWEQRAGGDLFLRTVRGDREIDRVFHLTLIAFDGATAEPVTFEVEPRPHVLRLNTKAGSIEIVFVSTGAMRFRGQGHVGLRLTLVNVDGYGNAQRYDTAGRWLVNAWAARMNYLLTPLAGMLQVESPAEVLHAKRVTADFLPGDDGFEGVLEEYLPECDTGATQGIFDAHVQAAEAEFAAFCDGQPPVPPEFQDAARLMAYVQWSALVAPSGHLGRSAMLMSKNHMNNVWSWDHCFNALALMPHAPALAWDQFCLPFDHQDAAGCLPDCVNDKIIVRNFTKPPIHGWTLSGLIARDRAGFLTTERLEAIYEPMTAWTRWWLTRRDQDGDGVPNYNHGNDCGWDNSTAFDIGFPIESPDLGAFLVLQMDTLSSLAERLGRSSEAEHWKGEANALLARTLEHCRRGGRFVAPQSETHECAAGDSLILFLPLILGPRLPQDLANSLVAGLKQEQRFLTEWGLATESITSSLYQPDGYWRGPIWAPPMLLLADGLRALSEHELAADIARRFCRLVAQSGSAENFDALTGVGLRDRAYTWTASVFLVLAREFLSHLTAEGAGAEVVVASEDLA